MAKNKNNKNNAYNAEFANEVTQNVTNLDTTTNANTTSKKKT